MMQLKKLAFHILIRILFSNSRNFLLCIAKFHSLHYLHACIYFTIFTELFKFIPLKTKALEAVFHTAGRKEIIKGFWKSI